MENGTWPTDSSGEFEPAQIEFPVTHYWRSTVDLCRGEVGLSVDLTSDELSDIAPDARPGSVGAKWIHDAILYELDRKQEIELEWLREGDNASLRGRDLRNNDEFDHILEQVDIDRELRWDEPYYDFALYHGWDTRRFFVDLTDSGDVILCPYCQTAMNPGEQDCPHCERDTTNDASIQLTPEQYCATERQSCTHCAAQLIEGSVACWSCTQWQS